MAHSVTPVIRVIANSEICKIRTIVKFGQSYPTKKLFIEKMFLFVRFANKGGELKFGIFEKLQQKSRHRFKTNYSHPENLNSNLIVLKIKSKTRFFINIEPE